MRHEFPDEWARFRSQTSGPGGRPALTLNLKDEHYPFWSQGLTKGLKSVDILARRSEGSARGNLAVFDRPAGQPAARTDALAPNAALGNLLTGTMSNIALPAAVGQFTLFFEDNAIDEFWLAARWGKVGG